MASVTQACAPVVAVINSSCAACIFLCHPDGGVLVNTSQVTQATQLSCPYPLDPDPELEHTLLSDSENMCTHTSHAYTLAHITKKFQRQYFILLLMLLSALFLSLFFSLFFSIFRKSWHALNWLLVTVWKKKMSLVHGHKSCRACQASAIPATVLHNKHHEHQRHTKWTLTFARSECGGSVCWLSLGWLLCAHSGLWWAVSGSGALIWASGLHMLGVAGLRCSGMVSARLRGEDWLCSIGFIFQQASWDQFSGPHGRPQRRGNLEVTLQAYIMSAHSCLDKVPCLGLSQNMGQSGQKGCEGQRRVTVVACHGDRMRKGHGFQCTAPPGAKTQT